MPREQPIGSATSAGGGEHGGLIVCDAGLLQTRLFAVTY